MKSILVKLLVLILLIVLAVISIWLERKDDDRAVGGLLVDPVVLFDEITESMNVDKGG